MPRSSWRFALVSITVIGSVACSARAGLVVGAWGLQTKAVEACVNRTVTQNTVSFPFFPSVLNDPPNPDEATPIPGSATSSDSSYDFDASGCSASFLFDFEHGCSSAADAVSSSSGTVTFSVSGGNLQYDLSGGNSGGNSSFVSGASFTHFEIGLFDKPAGGYVFQNIQEGPTPDWAYEVGVPGPDSNTLTGDMTGTLLDGHTYRFEYAYRINHANGSSSASGFGHLDMQIQSGSVLSLHSPDDAAAECGAPTDPAHTGFATSSDPCGAVIAFSDARVDGACPDTYTIVRTWTATNIARDSASR